MSIKNRIKNILRNPTEVKATNTTALEDFKNNLGSMLSSTGRDLKILVSNIDETFYLLGNDIKGLTQEGSELSYKSYSSLTDIVTAAKTAFVPVFGGDPTTPYSKEFIIGGKEESENEVWYFVNGIATSEGVAKINGQTLSDIFDVNIHVLYNPSFSIPLDLIESVLERTYSRPTKITESVYEVVKGSLEEGKKVKLLGHSQGGIITSSVINRLIEEDGMEKHLKNIELYTFASAATGVKHHLEESKKAGHAVPYNEHFINKKDFVARFGCGSANLRKNFSGEVFELNEKGHLLNAHYLKHFAKGKYDPEDKSRLSQYYKRDTIDDNPEPIVIKKKRNKL